MFEILIVLLIFVLLFSILLSIGASLILIVILAAVIAGVVKLLLYVMAAVIERITGKSADWMNSGFSFMVGLVASVILIICWYRQPVDPIKVTPQQCAVVGRTESYPETWEGITREEQIEGVFAMLDDLTIKRWPNVRFLNEGMIDESGGEFLYFWDKNRELIQKVRIFGDYLGVSDKEDGEYVYYRIGDQKCASILNDLSVGDNRLNAEENYGNFLDHFPDCLTLTDGAYTFTMPDFPTESWQMKVCEDVKYMEEGARVMTNKQITYLELNSRDSELSPGDTVSFTLENFEHEAIRCSVILDGGYFEYSLPLPEELLP